MIGCILCSLGFASTNPRSLWMQKQPSPVARSLPGLSCSLWPAGSDHKESIHAFFEKFVKAGSGGCAWRDSCVSRRSAAVCTGTVTGAGAEEDGKPGQFVCHGTRQEQAHRRRPETGRLQGL